MKLAGLCGWSRAALGACVCGSGPLLGPMLAILRLEMYTGDLGLLLGLYGRSWTALGSSVCGPGALVEPMFAVTGRSWASMGDPGPL